MSSSKKIQVTLGDFCLGWITDQVVHYKMTPLMMRYPNSKEIELAQLCQSLSGAKSFFRNSLPVECHPHLIFKEVEDQ